MRKSICGVQERDRILSRFRFCKTKQKSRVAILCDSNAAFHYADLSPSSLAKNFAASPRVSSPKGAIVPLARVVI